MTTNVALLGAGGKMGQRITNNLRDLDSYDVRYVEISQDGVAALADLGIEVMPVEGALVDVDVVVLAVPDRLIGEICGEIVPSLPSGAMVMGLDPAAGYAGVLPQRSDISYFIAHPCHAPVFQTELEPQARIDWFGGVHASQSIVCALHQGPEEHYAIGEALAKAMFGPIIRAHRVTTEQMALLEPALVETLLATCLTIIREGMDTVIEMGVPEAAARDFLLGHIRTELAIIFDEAGFPFSDGALLAIDKARDRIFLPDWKENVFAIDNVRRSVDEIVGP